MPIIFKQSITIETNDYQISISTNTDNENYILRCCGDGDVWQSLVECNKQLERLKNGLLKQQSMSITTFFTKDRKQLTIKPVHSLFDIADTYVLHLTEKTNIDKVEMFDIVHRLTEMEKNNLVVYPIKKDILGPSVMHKDIFSNIDRFRKLVEDYTIYYMRDKNLSTPTEKKYENQDIKILFCREIHNYYNITIVHQKTKPVPTENQFVISMLIHISTLEHDIPGNPINTVNSKYIDVIYVQDVYTIFTKKFQDSNTVGFINRKIEHKESHRIQMIDIHIPCILDLKIGCPNIKVINPTQSNKIIGCSWKDFYKYFYFLELPFDIPDGIYRINPNDIDYKKYFLVKHNKIYPWINQSIQPFEEDIFAINDNYDHHCFMKYLPIDKYGYKCSFEIIL